VNERAGPVFQTLHVRVVETRRERWRRILGPRSHELPAMHWRGSPQVSPGRKPNPRRPASGRHPSLHPGLAGRHVALLPEFRQASDVPSFLRPRSVHLYGLSILTIVQCVALWIRAKVIGEDERGNAERRALFVGLWPAMFWLLGDALRRSEERRERSGFTRALRRG
jgi:hypothetical protein